MMFLGTSNFELFKLTPFYYFLRGNFSLNVTNVRNVRLYFELLQIVTLLQLF